MSLGDKGAVDAPTGHPTRHSPMPDDTADRRSDEPPGDEPTPPEGVERPASDPGSYVDGDGDGDVRVVTGG
jgi:hypothetical protein